MESLLMFILGLSVGVLVWYLCSRLSITTGTLRIDDTDVNKEVFSIEVDNLNELFYKKYLKLTIVKNDAQK